MIDHDIEDDADRKRMPVLPKPVSRLDEFDQVLLRPEMRIDPQVVVDVVAVVGVRVVFKDRRQPDGGASEAGNVIEVPDHDLDAADGEAARHSEAHGPDRSGGNRPYGVVLKAVDHQEINKLLAPLAVDAEIALAGNRREID